MADLKPTRLRSGVAVELIAEGSLVYRRKATWRDYLKLLLQRRVKRAWWLYRAGEQSGVLEEVGDGAVKPLGVYIGCNCVLIQGEL